MTLYGNGTPTNTSNMEISSTAVLDHSYSGGSNYDLAPEQVSRVVDAVIDTVGGHHSAATSTAPREACVQHP